MIERIDWIVGTIVVGAALSIPSLAFAAWWFDDGTLLFWIVIPFIFFMAG